MPSKSRTDRRLVLGSLGLGLLPLACLTLAWLLGGGLVSAAEALPPGAKLTRIVAHPTQIELRHPYDYAQLVLTGVLESGETVDVTRMAEMQAPPLVKLSDTRLVRPVTDGAGELLFSLAGQSVKIPVNVTGQTETYSPDFVRDVMPVLSKLSCNSGTCHGAQDGKNGFKLSLRGYDPQFDHRALTDDLSGRRFNRAAPDHSLMLMKPAGVVPHVGGVLTSPEQPYYQLLRSWIAEGVKLDLNVPRVERIELFPQNPQIPLAGMTQQMIVLAFYTDGKVRDVSAEAFIESSLAEVVEADKFGLLTAARRGEAAVLARYEGAYAATTITVMGDRSGFQWQETPENNFVDNLVYAKLRRVKILPSGLCSDADFVRRLYLDLTGLPPEADQVSAFLADPRDSRIKRDELVDRLVGSEEFIEHWTNKWADLLTANRKFVGEKGVWAMRHWIRQAVRSNMPYDQFAYAVLNGSGSTFENPAAAYWRILREPDAAVENSTQLFLGVRFSCNKCHDHPFERWTQTQYYELGAYFAQVGRKPGSNPGDEVIYDLAGGEIKHARTGQTTAPAFPYQHDDVAPAGSTRREQFAKWVTSPKNQYFAKSYVNRIWSYLLGVGLIEPIDDLRAGNPPTNPELLDRLTDDFIAQGFDVQWLFRTICKSRTYQHSLETNTWNADDTINYSHATARRLPAETLFDAIHRVTGSTPRLPGLPAGLRAAQLPDANVALNDGFLDLFGKPPRESACECERSGGVILGQALNLVNGPTIANAVADPGNRLTRMVASEPDDRKLIDAVFMAILARPATEKEIATSLEAFTGYAQDGQLLEQELAKYDAEVFPARFAAWQKSAGQKPVWHVLQPTEAKAASGADIKAAADGSLVVSGAAADKDVYTVTAKSDLVGITAVRLEILADPSLPAGGPGRALNGNLVLQELHLSVAPAANPSQVVNAAFATGATELSQEGFSAQQVVDGNPGTGWALFPHVNKNHSLVFELTAAAGAEGGSLLTFTLDQNFGGSHTIGKFRISVTTAPRPVKLDGETLPAPVAAALAVPADQRNAEQQATLLAYFQSIDTARQPLAQALQQHLAGGGEARLRGAQDVAWALLNSPAFLFNR